VTLITFTQIIFHNLSKLKSIHTTWSDYEISVATKAIEINKLRNALSSSGITLDFNNDIIDQVQPSIPKVQAK